MMRPLWIWIALLALATVIYFPALKGGFLFDDMPNIVDNPAVHLTSFSFSGLKDSLAGLSAGPLGRPVSVWSFALTHLFFGLDAYAFKAINLAIHLANGLLVGWFVSLLLHRALPPMKLSAQTRKWLPVWVAAVWLVHPIHFVAAMMAVQRMTLLAGMFTLMGLIAYLKALEDDRRKWMWLGLGWLVCWPLAFLSKETGFLFPIFALVIAIFAKGSAGLPKFHRGSVFALPLLAVLLVGAGMYWHIGLAWIEAGYAVRSFTLFERLLTEARVLWFYLGQILLPSYYSFALYLDWFPVSSGVLEPPETLLAVISLFLAVGAAIRYRNTAPMLGFALAWFLGGHSLESTFLPLEIAHEHRNYIPSLGPMLAVGFFAATMLERLRLDYPKPTIGLAALAVVFLLSAITWLRADQMSTPLIGTQIEATRHATSARANYNAAWALIKAGYGDIGDPMGGNSIRYYFEHAETVDPSFKLGYHGLLVWVCASGRPVESQWLDMFAQKLEKTVYGHGQKQMPAYLLKPLIAMPACLSREDALRLFMAGAGNPRLEPKVRSQFLESASDYELAVWGDLVSAKAYLERAAELSPLDGRLRGKLDGYTLSGSLGHVSK